MREICSAAYNLAHNLAEGRQLITMWPSLLKHHCHIWQTFFGLSHCQTETQVEN